MSQRFGYEPTPDAAPVSQSYASDSTGGDVGYPKLDQYGRVKDLHFKNAAATNATLQRFQYGYDPADQRTFARVTQRAPGGTAIENERSWLYGYDRLGRLVSTKHGALDGANTSIGTSTSVPTVRDSLWTMDLLGNWVGDAANNVPGRQTLGVPNSTGPPRELSFTDTVNRTNAITQRTTKDGTSTSSFTPAYDAAGNLVLDQDYLYEYDAWNRLVKVSDRNDVAATTDPAVFTGTPGPWIAHYTYDGLGRLIRKQSPWPTLDPYGRQQVRTEHYYYDGVRRVQEVFTDPLPVDDNAPLALVDEFKGPQPHIRTPFPSPSRSTPQFRGRASPRFRSLLSP